MLLPYPDIYAWRAADAQAKSAFCLGEHVVAFTLWRQLLAFPDIPDGERQRIAANRDEAVPAMLEVASNYPDTLVRNSIAAPARVRAQHRRASDAEVTVSLIAGPDLVDTQQTLNSFLNCCNDVSHVGRFLLIDAGLSAADREMLQALYEFVEIIHLGSDDAQGIQLAQVREQYSRAILATSGSELAVFRARESHHSPYRGTRRGGRRVPGGRQLGRCDHADRCQCTGRYGSPNARRRPLRPA